MDLPDPPPPRPSLRVARWIFVAAGAGLLASVGGVALGESQRNRWLAEVSAFGVIGMAVLCLVASGRYMSLRGGRRRRMRGPAAYPERPDEEPYWARPLAWIVLGLGSVVVAPLLIIAVKALVLALR